MSDKRKLYIEFRVQFNPSTNQDFLHDLAEQVKDELYDMFDGKREFELGLPAPQTTDVTYEVCMEIPRKNEQTLFGDDLDWIVNPSQES